MGLDIFFSEDIAQRLSGIELTASYFEPGEFKTGFLAALEAVSASFGLSQTVLIIPHTEVSHGSEIRTINSQRSSGTLPHFPEFENVGEGDNHHVGKGHVPR